MQSVRIFWWIITGLGLTLALLAGCSENKSYNPYGEGSIMGTVEPKDCGAKIVVMQPKPVDSTWVDKDGYYRIDGLTVGTYSVEANASGYAPYRSKEITVYSGGITTVPLMKLSPVPEHIIYTYPRDGDKKVSLAKYISISFKSSMEKESVESSFSIEPHLEGEFDWESNNSYFRFLPSYPLIPETTYTVTLTRGALTEEGDSLSFDYSFSFTTDELRVVSVPPKDGMKEVKLPGPPIELRFNSEMDRSATQSAISIDPPLECTYEWNPPSPSPQHGCAIKLIHYLPFRADTQYAIVIDESAKDANGFNLKKPDTINFSTEGVKIRYSHPPNGILNVPTYHTSINLKFNTWIDERSLEEAFSVYPVVNGVFHFYSDGITFQPGSPLRTNTKYTVSISQAVTDIYGTGLSEPYSFSFTTEPLKIHSTSPINGATLVDTTTSISIYFNTYMDKEKTENAFSITPSVEGSFKWYSFETLRFQPDGYLQANTTYTVKVDTTAQDIHGGKLPYPYQFSFSTRK